MKTETMQRFDALVDTIRREVQRLDDDEMICQGDLADAEDAAVDIGGYGFGAPQ